jgi:nitrite reductase (cytochrome c-552)
MAYYDEVGHSDWTHATSGAPVLKAQHPEFEMFNQGVHARSGVTCSDCHMPFIREGARKVSDHWVRSPLLNVNNACQTCHTWSEDELVQRVHTIQDRTYQIRSRALDAVLQLTRQIQMAVLRDSTSASIPIARNYQRRAQFFTDFVEAENSMGFHADQEALRILATAIDYARLGQLAILGVEVPAVPEPLQGPAPQTVTPGPADD